MIEVGQLRVKLAAPLAAGQTRIFTVVRDFDLVGFPTQTSISCTISEGEDECIDAESTQSNNGFVAILITSAGPGLVATDDAYYGLATRAITN